VTVRYHCSLLARLAVLAGVLALPQPAAAQASPATSQDRPTGLPTGLDWTFNFDASWGTFGFANSLFQNPKEGVAERLSDQWFEGAVKPKLSGAYTFASSGTIYGSLSAVGERTYGSAPFLVGDDVSSFQAEDLAIGWRSGPTPDNTLFDVTIGRVPYQLGHGMLVADGTAEGGSRGGYWTNARKAFQFAAIARVRPGSHLVEAFYLDKDDLPERDTGTRLWGANYEYAVGAHSTFGATYLRFNTNFERLSRRDNLNVINVRAYTAPIRPLPDLSFEAEYTLEQKSDAVRATAWTMRGDYALTGVRWTPTLTYRYASFEGDDPATERSEAFDPLLPGFDDWGSWWQGEIAGEYFLSNSNLRSHMARVHLAPTAAVGTGLIGYLFRLDEPTTFAPGVTERAVAVELDAYVDWSLNDNVTISVVGAFANPQAAVEQAYARTKPFAYGMVFLAYSY
jgi:hypothetical protein